MVQTYRTLAQIEKRKGEASVRTIRLGVVSNVIWYVWDKTHQSHRWLTFTWIQFQVNVGP